MLSSSTDKYRLCKLVQQISILERVFKTYTLQSTVMTHCTRLKHYSIALFFSLITAFSYAQTDEVVFEDAVFPESGYWFLI